MKRIEVYTTKLQLKWLKQDLNSKNTYHPKDKIKKWIDELNNNLNQTK